MRAVGSAGLAEWVVPGSHFQSQLGAGHCAHYRSLLLCQDGMQGLAALAFERFELSRCWVSGLVGIVHSGSQLPAHNPAWAARCWAARC